VKRRPRTARSLTGGSPHRPRKPPDRPVRRADRGHGHSARSRARDGRALPPVRYYPPRLEPRGRDYEGQRQRLRTLCWPLLREDEDEIDTWFDRIESGMCYVNREQSATTGALVEAQPFGGWKYPGRPGNSRAVRGTSSSSCVSRVGLWSATSDSPEIATATAGPISAPP